MNPDTMIKNAIAARMDFLESACKQMKRGIENNNCGGISRYAVMHNIGKLECLYAILEEIEQLYTEPEYAILRKILEDMYDEFIMINSKLHKMGVYQ